MSTVTSRAMNLGLSAAVVALAGTFLSGCYTFQPAPDSAKFGEVVQAVESVLKERYYQSKVYKTSGNGYGFSLEQMEGTQMVKHSVEIRITPIRTGHYLPEVRVRKYVDVAEPPIETGDRFSAYDVEGPPAQTSNWQSIYRDHPLEIEIRDAILEKLNIAT